MCGWLSATFMAIALPLPQIAFTQLSSSPASAQAAGSTATPQPAFQPPGEPLASEPQLQPTVEVVLVSDQDCVVPGRPLRLGVHFKIAPGWHIYFRDPGEVGRATTVEFSTPPGTTAGQLEWRKPHKYTDFGLSAYGYTNQTTIASTVAITSVEAGATSVTFRAHVTWLACENECMPGSADVELTLPVGLAGSVSSQINADLFAGLLPGDSISVTSNPGRILDDGHIAVESSSEVSSGLLAALLFAFVGGLILNLMPCVLPVISLKIMSFVHQSGQSPARIFTHGLWYTAGTVASFAALALAVVALRSAGLLIGWGFQFQSPVFLVLLSCVVLTMALSMLGLFFVNVRTGQGLSGLSSRKGYAGSFFTGVLATILATPCSAPFLGTAIGFAFAQPASIIFAIFLFIGLGLSAPYLVLSARPGWLKRMPKPGPWMEMFKQTMGFLMLGSVVWLVSIIAEQVGAASVGVILGFLLAVSFAVFLWSNLTGIEASDKRKLTVALVLLGLLTTVFFVFVKPVTDAAGTQAEIVSTDRAQVAFQPFDRQELDRQLASGKVVFIDFTAKWCLTCKVNEARAINTEAVRATIERLGIIAIKADWTHPDAEIARLLAQLGRSSVPTYVVFPADANAKPILLSELITERELIEVLERAAGKN